MWPLGVLLVWALVCAARGNVQEEIFTRPGSDLLLPMRYHLTLNHEDGTCDEFEWKYKDPSIDNYIRIARHKWCNLTTNNQLFTNTRISENGSLIIDDVTLDNDGIYRVEIHSFRGDHIQRGDYIIHVEGNVQEEIFTRPGSDLLLPIRLHLTLNHKDGTCHEFEWKYKDFRRDNEIIIASHKGCKLTTNNQLFSNTRISGNGSLIINYVAQDNDGTYSVEIHNSRGDHIQTDHYIVHVEGNVQEEIFTRPGSDLLLPIRRHLTLNHEDGACDEFEWTYEDHSSRHNEIRIARHTGCKLNTYNRLFPNTRISENGSLIIDDVTLYNDGIYSVDIHNSTGDHIQRGHYIIHVEVPVLVPVLNFSCLEDSSAEISCKVETGTKPNISVSVIGGSQGNYSASSNNITAIVGSPGPWNITCYVENHISWNMSKVDYTCPVPLSDIEVTSFCLPDGSAKFNCSVNGSDPRYSWTMNGRSVSNESWVTLPPPVSGTLCCDVTNQINNQSKSININCSEIQSHWGHLLSHGVVFVLYTGLIIYLINELMKMKNERNQRMRKDMEMEPTYYNERN